MHITAIIPARLNSTRLEQKLLISVEGKTILQHVFERVDNSALFDQVIIATDSKKILKLASKFGAHVIMTDKSHRSGTDRIAEVTRGIKTDIIVNVQGDEPLIEKEHLRTIISLITKPKVEIATLCSDFESVKAVKSPSNVKVVSDINKKALYFSRSVIPFPRADVLSDTYKHHIGLYAFKRKTLLRISRLKQSELEIMEGLEQLRWLHNGFEIYVGNVKNRTVSIDTAQDLKEFKGILKSRSVKRKRK